MVLRSVNLTLSAGANTFSHKIAPKDEFLVAANLEETDASGNPQWDSGSIWIQDDQGDASLSLVHGGMVNGQIAGFGLLPLPASGSIIGKIWHARAGHLGKFNVYTATAREIQKVPPDGYYPSAGAGGIPGFNWNVRQITNNQLPAGRPKIIAVDGAATVVTVALRPDDGYIWQVMEAVAFHDDPAARNATWRYYDGTNEVAKDTLVGLAATNPFFLSDPDGTMDANSVMGSLILNNRVYADSTLNALAAGKKLYIRALVLEMAE